MIYTGRKQNLKIRTKRVTEKSLNNFIALFFHTLELVGDELLTIRKPVITLSLFT